MIEVELEDLGALQRIEQLLSRIERPRSLLMEIGEVVVESTKERFRDGVDPDGAPWEPNSPVTIAIYGGLFASAGAKKPLVGETRRLSGEISWQLEGDRAVAIGSPMPYAAMQQFGGTRSEWPHLWGDIPARPFLGLSDSDERRILDLANDYFGST
tara:strand:- start:452 stop:919 length:468 start_codon:yes stop_codon:yes gene_type:complete